MLSQTTEYALRAMVCIAQRHPIPMTTGDIAAKSQVPAGYLSKVLQGIARAGLVLSQRGIKGGFVLSRPKEDITIYEIVSAVDPLKRITSCPLKIESHKNELCSLHKRLDSALAAMEATFRATTLGEIVEHKDGSNPLCSFEHECHGHEAELANSQSSSGASPCKK